MECFDFISGRNEYLSSYLKWRLQNTVKKKIIKKLNEKLACHSIFFRWAERKRGKNSGQTRRAEYRNRKQKSRLVLLQLPEHIGNPYTHIIATATFTHWYREKNICIWWNATAFFPTLWLGLRLRQMNKL